MDPFVNCTWSLPERFLTSLRSNNTALTEQAIEENELSFSGGGGWIRSTLSGIATGLYLDHGVLARLWSNVAGDTPSITPTNTRIYEYIANYDEWSNGEACAPRWSSPQDDILAAANEMMFRVGYQTVQQYDASWFEGKLDPGVITRHNVTGTPISPINVFVTDYRYYAGAVVLEVVTILAILVTFYGWWRLDPERSLSPLEIAKARWSKIFSMHDRS